MGVATALRCALCGALCLATLDACERRPKTATRPGPSPVARKAPADDFQYVAERFGDVRILRYRVRGFDALPLERKRLLYYLQEASLSGRDILYDQYYRHNLAVRRTLEAVLDSPHARDDPAYGALLEYAKLVWLSSGIHHFDTGEKLAPRGWSAADFARLVRRVDPGRLPLSGAQRVSDLIRTLSPVIFDPRLDPVRTYRGKSRDPIAASAVNFYPGVETAAAVRRYYQDAQQRGAAAPSQAGHRLNSQLAASGDELVERVWRVGGMYGPALEKVVYWLRRALPLAESDPQRRALSALIELYERGDPAAFQRYAAARLADRDGQVDLLHGFIDTADDPLGYRGTYHALLSLRDDAGSERLKILSAHAQWFEQHAPAARAYKGSRVADVPAQLRQAVLEVGRGASRAPAGAAAVAPGTPRARRTSTAIRLGNLLEAYEAADRDSGVLKELAADARRLRRAQAYQAQARRLLGELHLVIGHRSGRRRPDVGPPVETLREYAAVLEEARADLVALYFILDPYLIDLRLMPSLEVGRAAYDAYVRDALVGQLRRVPLGQDLRDDQVRGRALVARWAFARGARRGVIDRRVPNGKTCYVVHDYPQLRKLFGQLLKEVQRISSEGDYAAAKRLVLRYGTRVDSALHREVHRRFNALGVPRYEGFLQPRLVPTLKGKEIVDVRLRYPPSFEAQQRGYSERYGLLPTYN